MDSEVENRAAQQEEAPMQHDLPAGTSAIQAVDTMYAQLIERAETLAAEFFAQASAGEDGKARHVQLLITVKWETPNSAGIYWSKRAGVAGARLPLITLPKGRGSKYPVGTFSSIREPIKGLCRAYETRLAEIREACFANRQLRRQLVLHEKKVAAVLAK